MTGEGEMTGSSIIPTMRYRDAKRMIAWLCDTFGLERQAVYEDGKGGIAHAQLTLGAGMIMLGSARDDPFGRLQSTPAALGGTTQSPYVVVPDADAVYPARQGRGRYDRDRDQGRRLRRPRLLLPRPGRPPLELRHLRPLAFLTT